MMMNVLGKSLNSSLNHKKKGGGEELKDITILEMFNSLICHVSEIFPFFNFYEQL